jgi:exodeoxyribonuclease V alpha subunit
VIIPVVPQHATMLRRSLLYTAVTRGSRVVVLVGHRGTLFQAVSEGETSSRCTRLEEWLRTMQG